MEELLSKILGQLEIIGANQVDSEKLLSQMERLVEELELINEKLDKLNLRSD